MTKGNFNDIISQNFNEIQRNFKSGAQNKGYPYDEDVMNEAFVSCSKSLKDKELSKSEAIKYYWVAYINKIKTKLLSKKCNIPLDDSIDCLDEEYDNTIDSIYDIIIEGIRDKFGIRDAHVWELYICKGKSAKEIRNMGFDYIDNFVYFNRKIKRYILNHIIPNNQKLKELIEYRKEV